MPVEHFEREVGKSGYTFKKLVKLWLNIMSFSVVPLRFAARVGTLISAAGFGEDPTIILSIVLKADYNILADGVQYFIPDEAQIAAMTKQID